MIMMAHDRDVRRYLSSHRIAKEPMLMAVSVQNKCTSNTKWRFIIYDDVNHWSSCWTEGYGQCKVHSDRGGDFWGFLKLDCGLLEPSSTLSVFSVGILQMCAFVSCAILFVAIRTLNLRSTTKITTVHF